MVIVFGGGNLVIDWVNELEFVVKKVYIMYWNSELNGYEV